MSTWKSGPHENVETVWFEPTASMLVHEIRFSVHDIRRSPGAMVKRVEGLSKGTLRCPKDVHIRGIRPPAPVLGLRRRRIVIHFQELFSGTVELVYEAAQVGDHLTEEEKKSLELRSA